MSKGSGGESAQHVEGVTLTKGRPLGEWLEVQLERAVDPVAKSHDCY